MYPKTAFCSCVVSYMKHFRLSSVDAACSDHEQLQEDEEWRDDEAEPQVFGLLLLGQLLAQQNLAHQLQAKHCQHPEEPQHSQSLLVLLVKSDGHDGCEVRAEAVCGEQWDEHQPPTQPGGEHVDSQGDQHTEDQQSQQVEEEFEGSEAQPLDQLPEGEQHDGGRRGRSD